MTFLQLISETLFSPFLLISLRKGRHSCCLATLVSVSASLPRSKRPHVPLGKTVFLYVLLVLRLQAGLPTIFQSHPNHLYYFGGDGVFKIRITEFPDATDLRPLISPSTWCLVDSNLELTTVPMYIQYFDCFIVQSSSPRQDRLEWTNKQSLKPTWYFLKPWTLSELFVG